jgi:esterase/lipase
MTSLLRHLALFAVYGVLAIVLVLVGALWFHLSRLPELRPWHLAPLASEFRAADAGNVKSLDDYRAIEAKLMAELETEVYAKVPAAGRAEFSRYAAGSLSDPRGRKPNWNLTFERPAKNPKGAVLLVHGLSDSPYAMRALADIFSARGWHVVGLRLPGHGTAPVGLTRATWEDWAAAVRMAARHLREKTGPEVPLVIGGYSTGAALGVEYALAALQGEALPKLAGLVLLSPAIGVSPAAAFAVWSDRLSHWTGVQKLAWTELPVEFDPYKYNGFTANAADQIYRLTVRIRERMDALSGKEGGTAGGTVAGMPPLLVFQSLSDATVSTQAVVRALFARLAPGGGHALVGFDINRNASTATLLAPGTEGAADALLVGPTLAFDLTIIANADDARDAQGELVVARHRPAGGVAAEALVTGLRWPPDTYSLSHVALPFRPDDPVYGATPPVGPWRFMYLGKLALYGERGVLSVSPGDFARLRHNPFFPYMEARLNSYLQALERR